MLLEFSAKNYKSFKDEMRFVMTPAPRITGLDYSITKVKIKNKVYKSLCSSVIYGPNAAGKTNIIGAMDTFKKIILRGHIKNISTVPNIAAGNLELIPFFKREEAEPVSFSIFFIHDEMLIRYDFSMLVGRFIEEDYENRQVISEKLYLNEKLLFVRNSNELIMNIESIRNQLNEGVMENQKTAEIIAKHSLNPQELFLMNGFKTVYCQSLVNSIVEWIEKKFKVIYRADIVSAHKKFEEDKRNTLQIDKYLNDAAKAFGISSNAVAYAIPNEGKEITLYSVIDSDKRLAVSSEIFESFGTLRFIKEFPLILNAMSTGGTLVIDEFDASIHPMALMSIINIFHNDAVNKKHAQLIFNTHNPIFLNASLFRRDEIKFVERDDESSASSLYQLSDFGTQGEGGVRKTEDYMKNYFVYRYGAIKEIDFLPLFEQFMSDSSEENN